MLATFVLLGHWFEMRARAGHGTIATVEGQRL